MKNEIKEYKIKKEHKELKEGCIKIINRIHIYLGNSELANKDNLNRIKAFCAHLMAALFDIKHLIKP